MTEDEAREKFLDIFQDWKVISITKHKQDYILAAVHKETPEEYDPFFSINAKTGEVQDYPFLTSPDRDEIMSKLKQAVSF